MTTAFYIGLFGVAGAVIGMAAAVVVQSLENPDDTFSRIAVDHVPAGVGGIVLSAGVAAIMSTASGALIAAATVARVGVILVLRGAVTGEFADEASVSGGRRYLVGLDIAVTIFSMLVPDVVTALTIAYDLLVGKLLVAILGGLTWRRGDALGAASSMIVGSVAAVIGMITFGVMSNGPIYNGIAASAVVFVTVWPATRPDDSAMLRAWEERLAVPGLVVLTDIVRIGSSGALLPLREGCGLPWPRHRRTRRPPSSPAVVPGHRRSGPVRKAMP